MSTIHLGGLGELVQRRKREANAKVAAKSQARRSYKTIKRAIRNQLKGSQRATGLRNLKTRHDQKMSHAKFN